jgi:hypothetical protein
MAKQQKMEVADKRSKIKELEQRLETLENEYSDSLIGEISKNYDVSVTRINRDNKMIEEVLMKSFEYETSEEYNQNRKFVLKYIPEDNRFMKEYFIKDISSDSADGDSFMETLDIKRKCTLCDIYYSNKDDDKYVYLAHVKSIPYLNNDIVRSEHMHAEQYLISIDVDKDGKIVNFDYDVCYDD